MSRPSKRREAPALPAPLGKNQGRGVASGFWFNIGGEIERGVNITEDGTVVVVEGNPDIGGSRASMAMMAAEVLGLPIERGAPGHRRHRSVGFSFLTGGSRVTFATGMVVTQAAEQGDRRSCAKRAAADLGHRRSTTSPGKTARPHPVGANAGKFEPLSLAEIAPKSRAHRRPDRRPGADQRRKAPAPAYGTHICDVEVDPETGHVTILRYTAVQDVGRAIHPSYVEGQIQGGVAQGIGWALNEEYIYDEDGRLENAGFLDYRMPVCSDLPMIDTVMVEVPNPRHPYGVKGVGEVPIVPPMAAVANAIYDAIGVRMPDLPISPPRLRAAIDRRAEAAE